jgi:hypothetical protein
LHSFAENEEDIFISNNVVSVFVFSLSSCAFESDFQDGGCTFILQNMYDQQKLSEMSSVSCGFQIHEKPKGNYVV